MPFPNRFDIKCKVCGNTVLAGKGWTEGPPWVTKCQPCSGVVAVQTHIEVRLDGKTVTFRIIGHLAGDAFSKYRAATKALQFKNRANYTDLPVVAVEAINALAANGLALDVASDVTAYLTAQTTNIHKSVVEATERADQLDARLRVRGLGLYRFQRSGVRWLASRTGALLNDPMGTGKSIQALTALPEGVPTLVICPAIAKGVWAREAAKWRPDLKITILNGRGSFRYPEAGELLITNYDVLADKSTAQPLPSTVVIEDEAHVLKNYKAKRTIRVDEINKAVRAAGGRTWLLTATPVLNHPMELWTLACLAGVEAEMFGGWGQFIRVFNGVQGQWGGYSFSTPLPEAAAMIARASLRREKAEVLPDMPSKSVQDIPVELSKQDLSDLDCAIAEVGGVEAVQSALKASIDNKGPVDFERISRARALLAKAKIPALLDLVESAEQQQEPLVVFSAHRAPIDMFAGRDGWAIITGDTAPEERTRIENAFQAGHLAGVACTIKAGGVAITLTHARMAVFVDREWTPALNEQAEDRIHRIGQTQGVQIQYLVGDHWLDERIATLLSEKQNIIDHSVKAAARSADYDIVLPTLVDTKQVDHEEERKRYEEAKAEATRIATERAAAAEAARIEAAKQEEARKQKERKEASEAKSRANAVRRGYVAPADDPDRRAAKTPAEFWAIDAIHTLAAADPDGAQILNGVGFSKADGSAGHWLSQELLNARGLTNNQWRLLVRLACRYPRQVGPCPKALTSESSDSNMEASKE